jgi:hypothetical protein
LLFTCCRAMESAPDTASPCRSFRVPWPQNTVQVTGGSASCSSILNEPATSNVYPEDESSRLLRNYVNCFTRLHGVISQKRALS